MIRIPERFKVEFRHVPCYTVKPVFETALGIVEISCVVYPNRALPVSENGDGQGRRHLIGCQPRSWSDVMGEKLTLFI